MYRYDIERLSTRAAHDETTVRQDSSTIRFDETAIWRDHRHMALPYDRLVYPPLG